ncbi:hypothetical protein ACHAPJ_009578 [Fusarium lateritium]
MVIEFEQGNAQRGSLFFTKLLPEIRRQIFIELFGASRVHVFFRDRSKVYKRDGNLSEPFPGWCHCICRKSKALPHAHDEKTHKWCYLATNILFTCTWAYQSGIGVLYHTNTLMFEGYEDFSMLNTWLEEDRHFDSLEFYFHYYALQHIWEGSYNLAVESTKWHLGDATRMRFTMDSSTLSQIQDTTDHKIEFLSTLKFVLKKVKRYPLHRLQLFIPLMMEATVNEDKVSDQERWKNTTCIFEDEEDEETHIRGEDDPDSDDED